MESENHFSENPLVETCSPASETQAGEQLDKRKDYFKERAGVKFAGVHLIIDCIGAKNLDCLEKVELCLRDAIKASGATLLHIHLHHFTPNGGISGVAVLAESHISIHSWPENGYAALDVFMCGSADPHKTLDVIKAAFEPDELRCNEILRGKDVLYGRALD